MIVLCNLLQGRERLGEQLVRFALTCALAYALTRGVRWVRWACVVFGSYAGLGLLSAAQGRLDLALPGVYFIAVALLIVSGAGAAPIAAPTQAAPASPRHARSRKRGQR